MIPGEDNAPFDIDLATHVAVGHQPPGLGREVNVVVVASVTRIHEPDRHGVALAFDRGVRPAADVRDLDRPAAVRRLVLVLHPAVAESRDHSGVAVRLAARTRPALLLVRRRNIAADTSCQFPSRNGLVAAEDATYWTACSPSARAVKVRLAGAAATEPTRAAMIARKCIVYVYLRVDQEVMFVVFQWASSSGRGWGARTTTCLGA